MICLSYSPSYPKGSRYFILVNSAFVAIPSASNDNLYTSASNLPTTSTDLFALSADLFASSAANIDSGDGFISDSIFASFAAVSDFLAASATIGA